MRTLLPFALVGLFFSPGQVSTTAQDGSSLVVIGFKWSKSRQITEPPDPGGNPPPASAVLPLNKNFDRNLRANRSPGARDPNADSTDGRAAALEQSVQDSRTSKAKAVDGFAYRVKVQNASTKIIEIVFFEYQLTDTSDSSNSARRQFLCGAKIKPGKEKELQAFSVFGPSIVASVTSLADKSSSVLQEKILINRVEYSDGSIWQRKDWKFGEVKLGIDRALATPWGSEMCRSL